MKSLMNYLAAGILIGGLLIGQPFRASAVDTNYKLAVGDVLHIQVLNPGFEEFTGDVMVQPDGRVKLPVKPPVSIQASGLPVNQFEGAAQAAFGRFIRNAALAVTLKSIHQSMVYMLGTFAKPGAVPIQGPMHALDVVALAGGAPTGDLAHVILQRGHTARTLDLEAAQHQAGSRDNVEVQPDDTFFVPEKRSHITVKGQVTTPRNLEFKDNLRLEEAIAAAGGPTEKADLSGVTIDRSNGTQLKLDLSQPDGSNAKTNIILQSDDIITVPEQLGLITIQGQVTKPQVVPFKRNTLLLQAIAASGGPTEKADMSQVWVIRKDGVQTKVDLYNKMLKGEQDQTVLQSGDIVTIPEQLGKILVVGQVLTSKTLEYKPNTLLQEAIASAGGPTEKADMSQVTIVHVDGAQTKVDLDKLIRTGQKDNTVLQPGDIVTVPELRDRVLVVGSVAHTQSIPYRSDLTLDSVLALAGGELPKADLTHIKLARTNPPGIETIDLSRARREGNVTQLALQPGDVITVPEMNDQVFVLGSVVRPGAVPYRPGMTLLEALSGPGESVTGIQGAGGPTDKANLYTAVLTRADGQSISIDLDKVINQGDMTQNVALKPNDSLYVPESKRLVYVFGAVAKPGGYFLRDKEKDKVLDALQLAGGPTANAEISKARIAKASGDGKVDTTPIRLDRILRNGEMQYNVSMKPNDVLYVPERGQNGITAAGILPSLLYTLIPFLPRL